MKKAVAFNLPSVVLLPKPSWRRQIVSSRCPQSVLSQSTRLRRTMSWQYDGHRGSISVSNSVSHQTAAVVCGPEEAGGMPCSHLDTAGGALGMYNTQPSCAESSAAVASWVCTTPQSQA
jgi:hypothetical protein